MALIIALVVLGAAFAVVEGLWPARAQPRWRDGMRTDLTYWFITPWISKPLATGAVAVVAVAIAAVAGVPLDRAHVLAFAHRATWFGALPIAAQIAIVLVVGDLIGYWCHRAFHGRALWRYHAIHHSSRELDWLSATRLHPVNDMLQRAVQVIPVLALGIDPGVVIAYVPALTLYAIAVHANVPWGFGPLRYVIASPAFHRWHHTSEAEGLDKNFAGLLPLWDLLFGTFYMPRGAQPQQFGVPDAVPPGVLAQLAWPFRRAAR